MKDYQKISYISADQSATNHEHEAISGPRNARLILFVSTFLISLTLGLIVNYARPAVYSSHAVLLTTSATAVDQESMDMDYQHVAIQKQKLLGAELLTETLIRLKALTDRPELSQLKPLDIQGMLSVEEVEGTNLLNMRANGDNPEILPIIINTWIDVYLEARALSVEHASTTTVNQIDTELLELDTKIRQARFELDAFRREHDISSMSREENELPARLRGLTDSFNQANEDFLKAQAQKDAINQALAQDQPVVPKQEEKALMELETEYRLLKKKLAEFDKTYTRDYLKFRYEYKNLPEQIKKLEKQIKQKKSAGKSLAINDARQQYIAAKQVLNNIRQQLDEHKSKSAQFATVFSRHQQLKDDLEAMELLARETRERRLKIESKQVEKYPQVDVVERATVNEQIISPDYYWGMAWAFIAALCLAFFAVWFKSYLSMADGADNKSPAEIIVNSFLHSQPHPLAVNDQQTQTTALEQSKQTSLGQVSRFQKMADKDIKLLLQHADISTQALILLLLSGLSVEELVTFKPEDINFEQGTLEIVSAFPRSIKMGALLHDKLQRIIGDEDLLQQFYSLLESDLEASLYCLAVDCGLNNQSYTLAELLRQSYIIYLVEQGLRLSALAKIVGYLPATELAGYAVFSPIGKGCDIDQVQTIHPGCQ